MPTNDLVNEYEHDGYIPLVEESTPIEELYNIANHPAQEIIHWKNTTQDPMGYRRGRRIMGTS